MSVGFCVFVGIVLWFLATMVLFSDDDFKF